VEILRVSTPITLQDLAGLEHYENLKELHLRWLVRTSFKEALPLLKRCTNLRRLTLKRSLRFFRSSKSCQELCDFIMELKQLTFFHMIYDHIPDCNYSKSFVDKIEAFVLSFRPNLEFYLSCCEKYESRVPTEFLYH
jgi:hypothetical protein